jgi:hypothetical protein
VKSLQIVKNDPNSLFYPNRFGKHFKDGTVVAPEVAAPTTIDPATKHSAPEYQTVHKLHIKAVYSSLATETHTINISTSKHQTIKELRTLFLNQFGLAADCESRLIDYWHDVVTAILKDDQELSSYNIVEGQKIVLYTKNEEGNWRYDIPPAFTVYLYSQSWSHSNRSYGQWDGPGQIGLQNLGNACFFNSALQCLLHSMPLVRYFLSGNWENEINMVNPIRPGVKFSKQRS